MIKKLGLFLVFVFMVFHCADLGSSSDFNENASFGFNLTWTANETPIQEPGDEVGQMVLEISSPSLDDIKVFTFDYHSKEGRIQGIPLGIEIKAELKVLGAEKNDLLYYGNVENVVTQKQTILALSLEKQPPIAPDNLVVMSSASNGITIQWADRSSSESGYIIERRGPGGTQFDSVGTVSAGTLYFFDENLESATTYSYRIRGYNEAGKGTASVEFLAATSAVHPNAPSAPSYLQLSPVSNKIISITWQDNANNELGYGIDRRVQGEVNFKTVAYAGENVTSYNDASVNEGLTYEYRIWAYNDSGSSTLSDIQTITIEKTSNLHFALTVLADPHVGGTVHKDPIQTDYTYNQNVVITAVSEPDYRFVRWVGEDTLQTAVATVSMTENKTLTAVFERIPYTFNVIIDGQGSVVPADLPSTVYYGDSLTLTASPANGWEFSGWAGSITDNNAVAGVKIVGNTSVTAVFTEIGKVKVSAVASPPEGGTVTKDPSLDQYLLGTTVSLHAIPSEGYDFVDWTGDTTVASDRFSLSANKTYSLTAQFKKQQCTLSVANEMPSQKIVDYGDTIAVVASLSTGQVFSSWRITSGAENITLLNPLDSIVEVEVRGNAEIAPEGETATYRLTVIGNAKTIYDVQHNMAVPCSTAIPANHNFIQWNVTIGVAEITNPQNRKTTVLLSNGDAEITAQFNAWPSLTSIHQRNAYEDSLYSYLISTFDTENDSITISCPDAELIPWLTFTPLSGGQARLQGRPTQENNGERVPISILYRDHRMTHFLSDTFTISIMGTNDAPIINDVTLTNATEHQQYVHTFSAEDADDDNLIWSLSSSNIAAGMSIHESTGAFSWTPPEGVSSNVTVEVSVTDGKGGNDSLTIPLTVDLVDDPPKVNSFVLTSGKTAVLPGTVLQFTVTASDPEHVLDRVELSVEGGALVEVDNASPYHFSVLTGLDEEVSYTVTAVDEAGNTSAQSEIIPISSGLDFEMVLPSSPINPPVIEGYEWLENYAFTQKDDTLYYFDNWGFKKSPDGIQWKGYVNWSDMNMNLYGHAVKTAYFAPEAQKFYLIVADTGSPLDEYLYVTSNAHQAWDHVDSTSDVTSPISNSISHLFSTSTNLISLSGTEMGISDFNAAMWNNNYGVSFFPLINDHLFSLRDTMFAAGYNDASGGYYEIHKYLEAEQAWQFVASYPQESGLPTSQFGSQVNMVSINDTAFCFGDNGKVYYSSNAKDWVLATNSAGYETGLRQNIFVTFQGKVFRYNAVCRNASCTRPNTVWVWQP